MQPRPSTLTVHPTKFDISYANLPTYRSRVKRTNQERRKTSLPYSASFFFSSSLTNAGLALPWVARMTWPTKKP